MNSDRFVFKTVNEHFVFTKNSSFQKLKGKMVFLIRDPIKVIESELKYMGTKNLNAAEKDGISHIKKAIDLPVNSETSEFLDMLSQVETYFEYRALELAWRY